jgi:hypothetical protein
MTTEAILKGIWTLLDKKKSKKKSNFSEKIFLDRVPPMKTVALGHLDVPTYAYRRGTRKLKHTPKRSISALEQTHGGLFGAFEYFPSWGHFSA